jgi:hypothetical protein
MAESMAAGFYVDTNDVWQPGTVHVMQQSAFSCTSAPSRGMSS